MAREPGRAFRAADPEPLVGLVADSHLSDPGARGRLGCCPLRFYPGAVALQKDPTRWRAYIKDAIIEPAIGRDLLALGAVRRPALLRQAFAIAVGSPAQIVSLQKLQGQLQYKGAIETVAHYLALLEDAYLVAALERFSIRAHRRRAAPRG